MSAGRTEASPRRPCCICGRVKSCSWPSEGNGLLFCMGLKGGTPPDGWVEVKKGEIDENGFRHLKRDDGRSRTPPVRSTARPTKVTKPAPPLKVFSAMEKGKKLTFKQRAALASSLALPPEATALLPFGFDGKAYTFPEVDGTGTIIGIASRFPDGSKKQVDGGHRGLARYDGWRDRPATCHRRHVRRAGRVVRRSVLCRAAERLSRG